LDKVFLMDQESKTQFFIVKATANREDQVLDFVSSNAIKKGFEVYSIVHPHGMKGYIIIEAKDRQSVEGAIQGVPYARGILKSSIDYKEIEHLIEITRKKTVNIVKNDIVEIIGGPFKRENAKVTRIDPSKDELVVELLNAAVPIPITLKIDDVKVIRRDNEDDEESDLI